MKWSFPDLEERKNHNKPNFEKNELLMIDTIELDARNGVNCIEMIDKDLLVFGDMDGNVSLVKL